jgi:hypothetical protein
MVDVLGAETRFSVPLRAPEAGHVVNAPVQLVGANKSQFKALPGMLCGCGST